MKYASPRESGKLSEVLSKIFTESKRVPKIAEELETTESTIYKRLNALQREDLVQKDKYQYKANRDQLCDEFWNYLLDEIRIEDKKRKEQFDSIKEEIYQNNEFRAHLLGVIENELHLSSTPLQKIFVKYRDRLEIRYAYVYQLTHNQLPDNLSQDKKQFWKYLQIIQAYLPHAAWTEPIHGTALESQIFPGEEHKMKTLDEMWYELVETADENLKDLGDR